ncbi:MAG: polysaccharide pyruvyl transferase family protein [Casimicrobiaceae bacterium]
MDDLNEQLHPIDQPAAAIAAENSLLESLRANPRRVVMVGNYGSLNLGDELLLSVISGWVKEAGGIVVAVSVSPDETRATHGVEAVSYGDLPAIVEAFATADLLVLGGGGLFQDYDALDAEVVGRFPAYEATQFAQYAYLAETLGVPRAALAQGVGPLRSENSRELTRDVYQRMSSISLRDAHSAAILQDIGVAARPLIAPDPGWSWLGEEPPARPLDNEYPALKGRKVLAVVVRDWPFEEHWEDKFVQVLGTALADDWVCLWIDFFRAPLPVGSPQPESVIARRLIDRLGTAAQHIIWTGTTIQQAYAAIRQCDAALAMRMHALLMAHLAGLPAVALEYDEKVGAMNADLGMPASQRLKLGEIERALGPALEIVTGSTRSQAFRVTGSVACELSRAALKHRDLLWEAMSATKQTVSVAGVGQRRWLTEWQPDLPPGVRRIMGSLEGRLHAQIADGAHLDAKKSETLLQLREARAEIDRLSSTFSATDALRLDEISARAAEAETWRTRYHSVINSRSYRIGALARWVQRIASRSLDITFKGLMTARAEGPRLAGRMALVKVHRKLSPTANSSGRFSDQLDAILQRNTGRPIIVLLPVMDFAVPLFQRPQHMARALAECGFLYFYCLPGSRDGVHGFREVGEGLVLTDQLALLQALPESKIWHVYSTDTKHDVDGLRKHMQPGDRVLYEYVDELHESIARCPIPAFVRERHRAFLADEQVFVVSTADRLDEEVGSWRTHNAKRVTNGVDVAHFAVRRGQFPVPPGMSAITARGKPIVGYFGALASWFDFDLLAAVAKHRPDLEFVLIGQDYDATPDAVNWQSLPNVHRLGVVPYEDLPRWACWFDVGMIPFKVNAITESTSPLKLFEYMALGLPVVATDLRECRKYSSVFRAGTPGEFVACLDHALAARGGSEYEATLAREAAENTWPSKGAEVASLIHPACGERENSCQN